MKKADRQRQQNQAAKTAQPEKPELPASAPPIAPPLIPPVTQPAAQDTRDALQALERASQHIQVGDLAQAESLCQQILSADPDQSAALNLLSSIAYLAGHAETALQWATKAIACDPGFSEAHSRRGLALHQLGRVDEAAASFQQSLALNPKDAWTHISLGALFKGKGQLVDAIDCYHKALDVNPEYADAHFNLGNALLEQSKLEEALASFQRAITLKPDYVAAHNNRGAVLLRQGKLEEAARNYRTVLRLTPDNEVALHNLGTILRQQDKLEEALASYQKLLSLKPGDASVHYILAGLNWKLGVLNAAVSNYYSAIASKPDYAEAHFNLGEVFREQGNKKAAIETYRKALAFKPNFTAALRNLGLLLQQQGELDEAVVCYEKLLSLMPEDAVAHSNFGSILKDLGDLNAAIASMRRALALKPDFIEAQSNLLFAEQYRSENTCESLYELHKAWQAQHGMAYGKAVASHPNSRIAERRLRVGFVSPDLRRHPVGYFVEPLFAHLNKDKIDIIAYSDGSPDDLSEKLKQDTSQWYDVRQLSDDALAAQIREDKIDILMDLAGHSANNRLTVFARKPAPVQASWAGYVCTTGLSTMDYLISDRYSTLPGEEDFYSETVVRMPDGWLCYAPPDYAPEVGPLPARKMGFITFASFSNPAKTNEAVVTAWAGILARVPDAQLLIKYNGVDADSNRARYLGWFEARGIDRQRILLEGYSPHPTLLARYNDIDIALDTFPYSGGLTTFEALWMGVPVITLPGQTFASRHSESHLSTIDLPELIAKDEGDYINRAVGLALDQNRLADLRANLRDQMAASPSCDGRKFAAGFTALLQDMWRTWCQGQIGGSGGNSGLK